MNRTIFRITGWGSFLTTLGAGWILWRQLAGSPQTSPNAAPGKVAEVPVHDTRPLPGGPAPPSPVNFEAQAVLDQLRGTFTRNGRKWYPDLKTWGLLGTLSQPQVEILLQLALEMGDAEARQALVAVLFEHVAAENPDLALEWVGRLPPESTEPTVAGMLSFWGNRDLAAASRWYEASLAERSMEFPAVAKVFASFTRLRSETSTGPSGIAAAMASYHEARSKAEPGHWSSREAGPVVAWARQTGQWSLAVAAAGDDSPLRTLLHRQWAAANPPAWLSWMRDHPQEGKDDAEGGSRSGVRRRDLLADGMFAGNTYSGASGPTYAVGPQLDGILALLKEEGADFTSEQSRVRVSFERGFPHWLAGQPTQASEWVKRRQKEPWIEPIIAILSTSVAKDDPVAAMAWAGQIKDAKLRQKTYLESLVAWRIHDPAAADAWAAEHAAELGH